jgi:hypothetical protein
MKKMIKQKKKARAMGDGADPQAVSGKVIVVKVFVTAGRYTTLDLRSSSSQVKMGSAIAKPIWPILQTKCLFRATVPTSKNST